MVAHNLLILVKDGWSGGHWSMIDASSKQFTATRPCTVFTMLKMISLLIQLPFEHLQLHVHKVELCHTNQPFSSSLNPVMIDVMVNPSHPVTTKHHLTLSPPVAQKLAPRSALRRAPPRRGRQRDEQPKDRRVKTKIHGDQLWWIVIIDGY